MKLVSAEEREALLLEPAEAEPAARQSVQALSAIETTHDASITSDTTRTRNVFRLCCITEIITPATG
jgi:hypothetical protein